MNDAIQDLVNGLAWRSDLMDAIGDLLAKDLIFLAIPVMFDLSQARCSARSFIAVGSNTRRMKRAWTAVRPRSDAIAANARRDASDAS